MALLDFELCSKSCRNAYIIYLGMQMQHIVENFTNEPSCQVKMVSDVIFNFFWYHQKSVVDLKITHWPWTKFMKAPFVIIRQEHCCWCFVPCLRIIDLYYIWMRYRLRQVHLHPQLLAVSHVHIGKVHERLRFPSSERLKWRSEMWDMIWSIYLTVILYKFI